MGYTEVLRLPVKAFWSFVSNIDRISAAEELRVMNVYAASQSSDGYKSVQANLVAQMGEVVKMGTDIHFERDELGFQELKMLAAKL